MRLVTSAKYLIGLAAASSVVVVLGGSALAADESLSGALSNRVPVVAPLQSDAPVSHDKQSTSQDEKTTSDPQFTVQGSDVVVSQSSSSQTSQGAAVIGTGSSSSDGTSTVAGGQHGVANALMTTSGTLSSKTDNKPDVAASMDAPGSHDTKAAESAADALAPVSAVQPIQPSVPEQTVVNVPASESVVMGQQRLVIQPVITSRSAVSDLATSVPSAPASSTRHTPAPAQSTGLLSALTSSLATTIVPHHIVPVLPAAAVATLATSIRVVVLFLLAGLTFGAFLRLGGFVHAARSDVVQPQLSFATPFLMGYVSALPIGHSPFLVVSETKTFSVTFRNALRKEEMV